MTPVFELDAVTRTYGEQVKVNALDGVGLTIMPGEFCAIVGRSGSGKSTLLGLLGCLDRPTSGTLRVNGVDVAGLGDRERSRLRGDLIGFVFQQFHLVPHLSAAGNVETALLYRGLESATRRRLALAALERVGLAERAHHRPTQLSGGEQQRVALARALVTNPRVVLADEPTGNLDTENAAQVLELLESSVTREAAVVVVTHDPAVAARAARRVEMLDGRIVADRVSHAAIGAWVE
ncbi:MAG TPA: ABC transporter ATP-binding protein [Candidatus Dormibacteraeota bacterium]